MTPAKKWILAISGLLAGNAIAMGVLAGLAGGGAQVIPAYYERAAHFDDEIDRTTASRALGWRADVAIAAGAIDATLRDAAGHPVDGARIRITGYQRAHVGEPIDLELAALGDGRYHADLAARRGRHDLTLAADRGDAHYQLRVAIEAR